MHLADIEQAADFIRQFTLGYTLETLIADQRTRSAVERQFQILTEAAHRLGEEAEQICPGPNWHHVRQFGNFLRHEYHHIMAERVWESVQDELPGLLKAVRLARGQPRTRLGILLSGRGSNFLAVAKSLETGRLAGAEIALVLSDKADAPGLDVARTLSLTAQSIPQIGKGAGARAAQEHAVLTALAEHRVDLVCLAGYMRIISPAFVAAYPQRILNMHPSLLPSFPGLHAQRQALDYGAKMAGCTVHFVDEQVDHGVIVLQRAVPVLDDDTEETLSARVLVEEHQAYPEAIGRVLSGAYHAVGRRYLRKT